MGLPTLDEYKQGATTWKREHNGVSYILSHHGISDYSPKGTWCFYILLSETMFLNDDDFTLFDREPVIKDMSSGSKWETYDYYDVPDYGFHGGITFYERNFYIDNHTGERKKRLKIGCDYSHLWDRESGYWQELNDVEADAKRLIDKLVEAHPLKTRCAYSGRLGKPDEFYETVDGRFVHLAMKSEIPKGWDKWKPKQQQEETNDQ